MKLTDDSLSLLTLRQAADELHVSIDCVRTRLRKGELAYHRIGGPNGRIRIARRDLENFLARNYTAVHEKVSSKPHRRAATAMA